MYTFLFYNVIFDISALRRILLFLGGCADHLINSYIGFQGFVWFADLLKRNKMERKARRKPIQFPLCFPACLIILEVQIFSKYCCCVRKKGLKKSKKK